MIGESWVTECVDAAISLEWLQCEQVFIEQSPHTHDRYRQLALQEDDELIMLFGLFLEVTQCLR